MNTNLVFLFKSVRGAGINAFFYTEGIYEIVDKSTSIFATSKFNITFGENDLNFDLACKKQTFSNCFQTFGYFGSSESGSGKKSQASSRRAALFFWFTAAVTSASYKQ